MNCFEKIKGIFDDLGIPSYPNVYTGNDLRKWATYNLSDREPVAFSDNDNPVYVDYVQVHIFLPMTENFFSLMQTVSEDLKAAGFTAPDLMVQVESEEKLQHLVFSCSIIEELPPPEPEEDEEDG